MLSTAQRGAARRWSALGARRFAAVVLSFVAVSTGAIAIAPTSAQAVSSPAGFLGVTCQPAVPTTCLAVGHSSTTGAGVVARTTTRGASWSWSVVPPAAPALNAVACATATTCTAVGAAGGLFSSDKGKTWAPSSFPAGKIAKVTLDSVTCPTSAVCIAVGNRTSPTGPPNGYLYRSNDAGQTWSTLTSGFGVAPVTSVACASATTCAAVGEGVLLTTNKAKTWVAKGVSGGTQGLDGIACASATYCVAVGPNLNGIFNAAAPGEVFTSVDGESTWLPSAGIPSSTSTAQVVGCAPSGACFVAGPRRTSADPPVFMAQASPTSSWIATGAPGGLSKIVDISCATSTQCVAVGKDGSSSWELAVGLSTGGSFSWTAHAINP